MSMRSAIPVFCTTLIVATFIVREPSAVAAPDDATDKKLQLKVEYLERKLASQSTDLSNTKLRLTRLERELQSKRSTSSDGVAISSQNDLAKLKNEATSIKSRVARLETKISGFDRTSLRRDVDRLEQRVSNLQADVQRLKSRR